MKNILINDQSCEIEISPEAYPLQIRSGKDGSFFVTRGHLKKTGTAVRDGKTLWVYFEGVSYKINEPQTTRTRSSDSASGEEIQDGTLFSPMPAKVFKLHAAQGDSVKKGEVVIVLEAMKMEHALSASFDGVIETLSVKEGDRVELGQLLLEIK